MRIVSPFGKVFEARNIVPVFEKVVKINGDTRRVFEQARGFETKPTGIAVYAEQPQAGLGVPINDRGIYIGNLKPEKLKLVLRELAEKGYYDFSAVKYQNSRKFDSQIIDGGESLPYNSEAMPWAFPNELNSMFSGCGCVGEAFGSPVVFGSPVEEDEFFDENYEGC